VLKVKRPEQVAKSSGSGSQEDRVEEDIELVICKTTYEDLTQSEWDLVNNCVYREWERQIMEHELDQHCLVLCGKKREGNFSCIKVGDTGSETFLKEFIPKLGENLMVSRKQVVLQNRKKTRVLTAWLQGMEARIPPLVIQRQFMRLRLSYKLREDQIFSYVSLVDTPKGKILRVRVDDDTFAQLAGPQQVISIPLGLSQVNLTYRKELEKEQEGEEPVSNPEEPSSKGKGGGKLKAKNSKLKKATMITVTTDASGEKHFASNKSTHEGESDPELVVEENLPGSQAGDQERENEEEQMQVDTNPPANVLVSGSNPPLSKATAEAELESSTRAGNNESNEANDAVGVVEAVKDWSTHVDQNPKD